MSFWFSKTVSTKRNNLKKQETITRSDGFLFLCVRRRGVSLMNVKSYRFQKTPNKRNRRTGGNGVVFLYADFYKVFIFRKSGAVL